MAGRQGQRRYWRERERRVNTPPLGAPSGQEEHGGGGGPATNERPRCAPDWASVRAPAPSWDSRDLSPSVPHIGEPLVQRSPPPPAAFQLSVTLGTGRGLLDAHKREGWSDALRGSRGPGKGLLHLLFAPWGFPMDTGLAVRPPGAPRMGKGTLFQPSPSKGCEIEAPPQKRGKGFLPSPGQLPSTFCLPERALC